MKAVSDIQGLVKSANVPALVKLQLNRRKKLSEPKAQLKEFGHGYLKEENLISIYESIKSLNLVEKSKSPRCQRRRETSCEVVEIISEELDG